MQKSSGEAVALETEDKRSILADVAAAGADFEARLGGLLESMRAQKSGANLTIQYPTEFDVQAFADDVAEALSLQSVGMSPEIMLAIRKQLAGRKLAGLPADERQKLIDTLKATDPLPAKPVDSANSDRQSVDPSNPNQAGPPGRGEPPPPKRAAATGADEPGKR